MLAIMQTEPVTIDGVAGPVVVDSNVLTGRCAVTVNGTAVPRQRRRFALPTTYGDPVEATVRTSLVDPYPVIQLGPKRYRTGPQIPQLLQVLTVLPFGAILLGLTGAVVGGLLGGVVAGAGVAVNQTISRSGQSTATKAGLMFTVLVMVLVISALLAVMVNELLR